MAREGNPAYGMLCFNRRHGSDLSLFGSSIKHNDIISMSIKHGFVDRSDSTDSFVGRGSIIDLEMSYAQFAEAITSFGINDGVPVTIRFTEKDGVCERPSFVSKTEQFENEFAEHTNKMSETANNARKEIAELLEKKSLTKADKQRINDLLSRTVYEIKENAPFILERFNEQMDKTIVAAKNEVEAFTQYKLDAIAKSALLQQQETYQAPDGISSGKTLLDCTPANNYSKFTDSDDSEE